MKIYLAKTQVLDIDGGQRIYKAPGYFNPPQELAEKWIGLGHAVHATEDNTHVPPEGGWAWEDKDRHGPRPTSLLPSEKRPKGGSEWRRAKPTPLALEDKQPKGGSSSKRKAKPRFLSLEEKLARRGIAPLASVGPENVPKKKRKPKKEKDS